MYRPPVVRHLNFTSWFSICSTSFSRFTPGVESRRNLELMEATTSFSASSTDHFRFFFSFRITCRRCQGHTTRPCLPLPREPTVGFVHRRRPRHPQLLLYFSCHVSRQLWAAVEVQTNLWSNRNQCGTRQYGYSRYRDDDDNDGDDDDGDGDDDGDDDRDNVDDKGYTCPFVSRMES